MGANTIPVQGGGTTLPEFKNPTLVPNFDITVASGAGTVDLVNPYQFLQANPRADATVTATLGGSVTSGDVLTIAIANKVLSATRFGPLVPAQIAKTVTAGGSDTLATLAVAFADAFNDDTNAQMVGLRADVAGAVITFRWNGPVGNLSTASSILTEPAVITIGGSATTGDTLNVLFTGPAYGSGVLVQTTLTSGQSTTTQATNLAAAISANSTLSALSISAVGSTNHVDLTVPGAAEPVSIAVFANPVASTATIGGTLTVGDVLNLTIHNTSLPGGAVTASYTTVLGDTTTSMAAGLAAAVNANASLIAANITASPSSAVVTISYPAAIGAMTYTESVTGTGTETITLSAAPTETLAIATGGTETITFGNSGVFASGTGPIIPYNNFQYATNSIVMNFRTGEPTPVDPVLLALLVNDGMPIV